MRMTQDEKQEFLAGLHIGVLGLNDPGRGPLTVPVWYDYELGGQLWFIIGAKSEKGKLLDVGTRLSLVAQSEALPYRYVSVEGVVKSITPSTAEAILAMAERYLGKKDGQAYASVSDVSGQIIVRVEPQRWLAVDYGTSS